MAKADIEPRKTSTIAEELNKLRQEISERAYRVFCDRAGAPGDALSDWLTAEHELVWAPPILLRRKDGQLEVRMALPGVEAKNVDVQVAPEDILIKAEGGHKHSEHDGTVHVCELRSGRAFRTIHLPDTIDPNSVKAEYRDGMLRLTAAVAKAAAPVTRKAKVKAA